MLPSADKLCGEVDFFSSSTFHLSTVLKLVVICLLWSDISPDMNPITSLLGIIKMKMRDPRPNNEDELKVSIKATRASLKPQQCHKLIASMPCCIDAVICAKGALFGA